ncbi:hypothetical protein [Gemella cuniculi]|uniref:hypothetical protein n=1 Tax=Gemella cuniculi TaxID=150240 RepID=UPI00040AC670|nr:hypothetical protein [Gemella cuniculi]
MDKIRILKLVSILINLVVLEMSILFIIIDFISTGSVRYKVRYDKYLLNSKLDYKTLNSEKI